MLVYKQGSFLSNSWKSLLYARSIRNGSVIRKLMKFARFIVNILFKSHKNHKFQHFSSIILMQLFELIPPFPILFTSTNISLAKYSNHKPKYQILPTLFTDFYTAFIKLTTFYQLWLLFASFYQLSYYFYHFHTTFTTWFDDTNASSTYFPK